MLVSRCNFPLFVQAPIVHDPGKGLKPFRLFTLPKSGTHLTEAILKQLGYTKFGPPHHFFYGEHINFHNLDPKVGYIAQIRDPRDIMVSLAHHIDRRFQLIMKGEKLNDPNVIANKEQAQNWLENKTLAEKLNSIILCDQSVGYRTRWTVLKQFQEAKKLLNIKPLPRNIILIRFEDLTGSKGGGDSLIQKKRIQKIAQHLDITISLKKAGQIAEKVWGTGSYRKGTIGQWKEAFSDENIKMFKEHWNQYLLAFGYETNPDWDVEFLNQRNASKIVQEEESSAVNVA